MKYQFVDNIYDFNTFLNLCVECIDLILRGIEFHNVGELHEKARLLVRINLDL